MQKTKNTYKKSGVNIDVANRFVDHIAKLKIVIQRMKANIGC